MCGHLASALREQTQFSADQHQTTVAEGRKKTSKRSIDTAATKLFDTLDPLEATLKRKIIRGCKTGAWLSTIPSTVSGTELSPREFRDGLYMRYGISPPDLPDKCDGCGAKFSIAHALSCSL